MCSPSRACVVVVVLWSWEADVLSLSFFYLLLLLLLLSSSSWSLLLLFSRVPLSQPVVLHALNPTVEQFCNRLHKGIMTQFKHAWVWGSSVKHQPQRVGKEHRLNDEDVIQIVKKV